MLPATAKVLVGHIPAKSVSTGDGGVGDFNGESLAFVSEEPRTARLAE